MKNGDIWWHFVTLDNIWAKNHVVYHDMSWHFMIWPLLIQRGRCKYYLKCYWKCQINTLLTDELFNLEFQFKSGFNLEFQPDFGIQLGIPISMGINLGEWKILFTRDTLVKPFQLYFFLSVIGFLCSTMYRIQSQIKLKQGKITILCSYNVPIRFKMEESDDIRKSSEDKLPGFRTKWVVCLNIILWFSPVST